MLAFIVEEIEFDLGSDDAPLTPDETFVLNDSLNREFARGRLYIVDASKESEGVEELLAKLSDDSGWLVSSFNYLMVGV